MDKFTVEPGWQILIKDLGLSAQDLLRQAQLPLDLFSQKSAALTKEEFYRFWTTLENTLADPLFPLHVGQTPTTESFSPPIFACLCSENLNIGLKRLAQYKPLIGPIQLDITANHKQTSMKISGFEAETPPPPSFIIAELVYFVHIARLAIREEIKPIAVQISIEVPHKEKYEEYFGTNISQENFNGLVFSAEDANKPFLSANEEIWSIFEPNLRKRMADLNVESGFRERVRACMIEILASGECSRDNVANRLGLSTRTMQRRLNEEGTSFQQELNVLRERLAKHYLATSHYSGAEIAFLLGYHDSNSFIRAFNAWTGQTPEQARSELRIQ